MHATYELTAGLAELFARGSYQPLHGSPWKRYLGNSEVRLDKAADAARSRRRFLPAIAYADDSYSIVLALQHYFATPVTLCRLNLTRTCPIFKFPHSCPKHGSSFSVL